MSALLRLPKLGLRPLGLGLSHGTGGGSGPARPTLFAPNMPLIRTGDSISARADNTDPYLWANYLAWGRFAIPSYGYHAISGSELNELPGASPRINPKDILRADRMSYLLAGARAGVAVMASIGVNSYGSGVSQAQMKDGYDELVAAIKATGAAAILSTILPAGTTSDPTPVNNDLKARTDLDLVNDGAAQWAAAGGYVPNTDSGNSDTLHPNVVGGIRGGRGLPAALIAAGYELGMPYGALGTTPADNLVSSSVWSLAGTSGAKAGANSANIIGNVPTGLTVTLVSGGVTLTISVVTRSLPVLVAAPGGGWTAQMMSQQILRLDLTGDPTAVATNSVLIPANISPGEPAGSMYEGMLYNRCVAADDVSGPSMPLNIGLGANSSTLFTWSTASTKNLSGFITEAVEGVPRGWSRGAVAATGTNGLLFQFRLSPGAGTARIELAMPYFRKTSRTAFAAPKAVHNLRDDLGGPTVGPTVGSATAGWTAVVGTPTAAVRPGEAWSGDGLTFSYQWQKSPDAVTWTNIAAATAQTYTPATSDGRLRCAVTGTNSFGSATAYTTPSTNSV